MEKNESVQNLTEKASYINGLAEGMELDTTTKEGRIIAALLDLVNDLSNAVSDLQDDMDQVYDELDAVDEDLTDVEDYVFGDEDEDDDGEGCEGCDREDRGDIYEITCPGCGKTVYADEKMLEDEDLACPYCGVKWEAEFDYEDEADEDDADAEEEDTEPKKD